MQLGTTDEHTAEAQPETGIVVVGGGFAGYFAARSIARRLAARSHQVTLVTQDDGFLYQPLLPDVAVGILDPRAVTVPLNTTLKHVSVVHGTATAVDLVERRVRVSTPSGERDLPYHRLVLAPGSVTRLPHVDGLSEHALGFKRPVEALYLRDHLLRMLEIADAESDAAARRALLTFCVVGAGYAGTELAAQMSRLARNLLPAFPSIASEDVHWLLVDLAEEVMPELGVSQGRRALRILRDRGVDVRLGVSVAKVDDREVALTDGTILGCSTVVWCAGVTPSPLISTLRLPTAKGRLVVGTDLRTPDQPEVYALGDAAAVPDVTRPAGADGSHPPCAPTAQHAMRQGKAVGRALERDLRGQPPLPYRHRDLGLVVDLGGRRALATPLGVPLAGIVATVLTRGYHLWALPTFRRRLRVLAAWLLAGRQPDDVTLGLIRRGNALMVSAELGGAESQHDARRRDPDHADGFE